MRHCVDAKSKGSPDGRREGGAFTKFFSGLTYVHWVLVAVVLLSVIGFEVIFGPEKAPAATFTTITGKGIALDSWRGRPVIVTFWATDCPACIREIPHWIELYRRYHDSGLELIAVAMAYDPPSHVVSMTQTMSLPYDVALDVSAVHARAFGGVNLTPTTVLIGPEGTIIERHIGPFDPDRMKKLIEDSLKG
ncbi:MAG: TlpA family protein disulfide reductase [Gammaproteobacteria bacterium]